MRVVSPIQAQGDPADLVMHRPANAAANGTGGRDGWISTGTERSVVVRAATPPLPVLRLAAQITEEQADPNA